MRAHPLTSTLSSAQPEARSVVRLLGRHDASRLVTCVPDTSSSVRFSNHSRPSRLLVAESLTTRVYTAWRSRADSAPSWSESARSRAARRPSSGKNVLPRGKVISWPSSVLRRCILGQPDRSSLARELPAASSSVRLSQSRRSSVCMALSCTSSFCRSYRPVRSSDSMPLLDRSSSTRVVQPLTSAALRMLPLASSFSRWAKVEMPVRSAIPRPERSSSVTCEASSGEMRPLPSSSQAATALRRASSGNTDASMATPLGTT